MWNTLLISALGRQKQAMSSRSDWSTQCVPGQRELRSETLSQNKIANKQKTKYKTEQQQKPNVLKMFIMASSTQQEILYISITTELKIIAIYSYRNLKGNNLSFSVCLLILFCFETETHCVAYQAGLRFTEVHLPLLSECWD